MEISLSSQEPTQVTILITLPDASIGRVLQTILAEIWRHREAQDILEQLNKTPCVGLASDRLNFPYLEKLIRSSEDAIEEKSFTELDSSMKTSSTPKTSNSIGASDEQAEKS